jgi:ABC-type multidrug transport system fused ATPase/permease subunit
MPADLSQIGNVANIATKIPTPINWTPYVILGIAFMIPLLIAVILMFRRRIRSAFIKKRSATHYVEAHFISRNHQISSLTAEYDELSNTFEYGSGKSRGKYSVPQEAIIYNGYTPHIFYVVGCPFPLIFHFNKDKAGFIIDTGGLKDLMEQKLLKELVKTEGMDRLTLVAIIVAGVSLMATIIVGVILSNKIGKILLLLTPIK